MNHTSGGEGNGVIFFISCVTYMYTWFETHQGFVVGTNTHQTLVQFAHALIM
jgi:hypothetical protein